MHQQSTVKELTMKWIITYVDVKFGDPLSEVEDRCFQGWEPFAITWVPAATIGPTLVETKMQRFWFKKGECERE